MNLILDDSLTWTKRTGSRNRPEQRTQRHARPPYANEVLARSASLAREPFYHPFLRRGLDENIEKLDGANGDARPPSWRGGALVARSLSTRRLLGAAAAARVRVVTATPRLRRVLRRVISSLSSRL